MLFVNHLTHDLCAKLFKRLEKKASTATLKAVDELFVCLFLHEYFLPLLLISAMGGST